MQAVLPQVGTRPNLRALVYDAKGDMLSILSGMNISGGIRTLNPFDARSVAWDMAADVRDKSAALDVASIFIPPEEGQNRYFSDAARAIVAGIMVAFHELAPGAWTFRDLVFAARTEGRLRQVLGAVPDTAELIAEYFLERRTFLNTKSTISARMAILEPIAALWHHATQRMSLRSWLSGNLVLVVGNHEALRAPLDAMNRILFQRLCAFMLTAEETATPHTWVFLDEVREAGHLDGLSRLMTKGRSKGVRVIMGFQDMEGMRAAYGDRLANELVAMCENTAILKLNSPATAQWAAQLIGEYEATEYTRGVSHGPGGTTYSTSEHIARRDAVLASELRELPPADRNECHGYFITPRQGVFRARVRYGPLLMSAGPEPNFIERPASHHKLVPWTDEDRARLNLPPERTQATATTMEPQSDEPTLDDIARMTRDGPGDR